MNKISSIRRIVFIACMLLVASVAYANNSDLLRKLDGIIEKSDSIVAEKNKRIDILKQLAAKETNTERLLERYHELSEEYFVLKFDSAKEYVEKVMTMAKKTGDNR